ncbi:MAG: dUTP diphosphatase [Chlamydiales bacterium]|nr:dUTP diphosphatase [Chlamydiales bacterium]
MQKVKVVTEDEELIPVYASKEAAGADVRANISEPFVLESGRTVLVPTGLFFEIPSGFEIQVRPRSGLALKHQVTVLNTPGTIDADYRGELGVILINHGKREFVIEPKMRIAQVVVKPVCRVEFEPVGELAISERGSGGFGHTGVQ